MTRKYGKVVINFYDKNIIIFCKLESSKMNRVPQIAFQTSTYDDNRISHEIKFTCKNFIILLFFFSSKNSLLSEIYLIYLTHES